MSMSMQVKAQSKLAHFECDVDYPIKDFRLDNQTNKLINDIINDIIFKYQKGKYTFVLEYRDDLISVIAYKILNTLSSISNFDFYLYGSSKRTRNYLKSIKSGKKIFKKYMPHKFISLKKLKQLHKNNTIYFSVYNSIYKVIPTTEFYRNLGLSLGLQVYSIMEKFTPEEIFTARDFYNIGYIGKEIDETNGILNAYSKWLKSPSKFVVPPPLQKNRPMPAQVNKICLPDDITKIATILQDVEQSDDINFYFFKNRSLINDLVIFTFNNYVKKKSNVIKSNYMNVDNQELLNYFVSNGVEVKTYGEE